MSTILDAARPELDELQVELAAVEQELAELAAWRAEVHATEQALAEHTQGAA
jgi:prefoldin subunit 5